MDGCRVVGPLVVQEHASPAPVDPLLQVGALGADRGVVAVAGHHDRVGGELGEQAVDRADDGVEVAALELVLPGPPGNSVSPLNSTGEPSRRKHIEPGRVARA